MAVLVRTRRLSNPSKRRRVASKRRNPSKRLSLKQKLHFGTARQRAAARVALKGRRTNPSGKKRTVKRVKAGRTSKAHLMYKVAASRKRRIKRRKNIGEIVSISLAGLGNPGRKRRKNTGMARKRLKKTASAKAARRAYRRRRLGNSGTTRRRRRVSHRRRNSGVATSYRRRRRSVGVSRRRRNPMYRVRRVGRRRNAGFGGGMATGAIGKALGVIGGAVGSKYLTQLALGGNNTGLMGYGGNLVASIALGWGVGKVMKNKDFGIMVTAGGIAALVLRVLSDNTPIGQYVNLSLSGMGKGGDVGLGIIQDSSFPVPQVAQPGSMTSFITPRATRGYVASAMASQTAQMKSAGSGMGHMIGGRKVRRAIM